MNEKRLSENQRPKLLERDLLYFESLLSPLEVNEIEKLPICEEPIVFIMGCARSGTTLVYQYLAHSKVFTYPTNFLSRFYYAPYVGARLQQMLFDYDFKNEILLKPVGNYFSSVLGKTMGALEPHEFWYFWRRFFHFSGVQQLEQQILEVSNSDLFIKELRAMQSVWSKPLLLKGMIMNWHIPFLASLYPKSYFLYVERSFAANAASLVRAREMFSGDENQWYSFKPPGYERVLHLDPNCQATWQVMATNQAIDVGLAEIPQSRVFRVTYDNFCRNPQSLLNEICLRFQKTVPQVDHLPDRFDIQGEDITIDKKWSEVLAKAASFLQLQVRQSER